MPKIASRRRGQASRADVQELARRGWKNKQWRTKKGILRGGRGFEHSTLQKLLTKIAAFLVDHKAGGLKFTGHYTPVGNPSIIVFLDLANGG